MTHQELVLSALRHLKEHGPLYDQYGICYNAEQHIKRHTGVLINLPYAPWFRTLIHYWPDRWISPDNNLFEELTFPVDGPDEYMDSDIDNLWANPRRLALLDYLIEQIRPLTFQVIP